MYTFMFIPKCIPTAYKYVYTNIHIYVNFIGSLQKGRIWLPRVRIYETEITGLQALVAAAAPDLSASPPWHYPFTHPTYHQMRYSRNERATAVMTDRRQTLAKNTLKYQGPSFWF